MESMAPKDVVRCWVCGRTLEEVRQSIGTPVPEETEVDRKIVMTNEARARFVQTANEWYDNVPDQFKNMDFNFVMGNPTQFKAVRFIGDVQQARKTHLEPLGDATYLARKGEQFTIGDMKVEAGDSRRKEVAVKELEDFERRTGRTLERSRGGGEEKEGSGSRPMSFDGFKLGDGIRYLREAGTLYYYVQQKLLEVDKEEEKKKMPAFEIGMARIKGFPKSVPLCTVCENLIKGL